MHLLDDKLQVRGLEEVNDVIDISADEFLAEGEDGQVPGKTGS
jgi:hypothetical protein